MRIQPARQAGQQRSNREDADLETQGVDAHGLGHLRAGLERAYGPAHARVQQVQHGQRCQQHQRPGQQEKHTALAQLPAEQRQAGHAEDAVVFAQRLQVAHGVVQRQAPGQRGQRQVVARHAQRDPAQHDGADGGQAQADPQGQPGREPGVHREPGRGVGADADKSRLAKRGQAADAGQQHQAEHSEAGDADVVELGDPELGHGQHRDQHNGGQHQQPSDFSQQHVSDPRPNGRSSASARTTRAGSA